MSARDALRDIRGKINAIRGTTMGTRFLPAGEVLALIDSELAAISAIGPSGDGDGGEITEKIVAAVCDEGNGVAGYLKVAHNRQASESVRVFGLKSAQTVLRNIVGRAISASRLASQTSGETAVTDELRAAADEAITTLRFQAKRGEKSLAVCFRAEAEEMSETAARLEAALRPKAEDRADGVI